MYKDKEEQKKANREAKQRQRQGMTKGMTSEGMTGQGMTLDVTQYPAILQALTDPTKRRKLEAIVQSLDAHKQLHSVFYGFSGLGMNQVAELLECTSAIK